MVFKKTYTARMPGFEHGAIGLLFQSCIDENTRIRLGLEYCALHFAEETFGDGEDASMGGYHDRSSHLYPLLTRFLFPSDSTNLTHLTTKGERITWIHLNRIPGD